MDEAATIGPDQPGEGGRSFRYAPLSSGLDLVRKALGQHQIATMQTTAIDAATGTINLTTVLAHASGEWIASDWPVCRLADTAAPHRMGAALTYARRYALFTLVGIAGEDDLDAPDLNGRPQSGGAADVGATSALAPSQRSRRPGGNGNDRGRPTLDPDGSAVMRDQLVHEVASVASAAEAAQWARTALPVKNKLTAPDARVVELAFDLRLSAFEAEGAARKAGPPSPEAAERLAGGGTTQFAIDRRSAPQRPWQRCASPLDEASGHRQERTVDRRAETVSGQGAPQIRGLAALPILRATALRSPPPALRPGPRARPQGERRVHGPALSHSPPRPPPLPGRSGVVGETWNRSHRDSSKTLDQHPIGGLVHAVCRY